MMDNGAVAVCTLFEGHYHFGVATLVNSLFQNGFRGNVYAGYRGKLPAWCSDAKENSALEWPGAVTLVINENLCLHFLPLETDYHLTNYKPDFMIRLFEGPAKSCDKLFYFDPDITLVAPFSFLETWVTCGVALCEDVNSPLDNFHPRRVSWRRYFKEEDIALTFKNTKYCNGGFVGIAKADRGFLFQWKTIQEAMAKYIGGLNRSMFNNGEQLADHLKGPFSPFNKTDQDALNAAIEAWEGNTSILGKEAMAFEPGTAVMPHALGQPKPWNYNIIIHGLKGHPPSMAHKAYWKVAKQPIAVHSSFTISKKQLALKIAAFVGRFYSRN